MVRLVFGPRRRLIDELRSAAEQHTGGRLRLAVAWARQEGVLGLLEAISPHIAELDVVVGVNDKGTTVEALLLLLQRARALTVFYKHNRQTFHPKLYLFQSGEGDTERATLIVGSGNLTQGGLLTNFEASLAVDLGPEVPQYGKELLIAADKIWDELTQSHFAYKVSSDEDVRQLYEAGYIVLESTVKNRRRLERRQSRKPGSLLLPTAPPSAVRRNARQEVIIPFPIDPEEDLVFASEDTDPVNSFPLPDRFFVRTLTDNDVNKLVNAAAGTFEPDLGESARDQFPSFWGWPDKYQVNPASKVGRREWRTKGRLITSQTPPSGILIDVVLWFRPERPGHLPEHRIRLGPIGTIRGYVPPGFSTDSLVVIERAPENEDYSFVVRLITASDPTYQDYASYLTTKRAKHRYGYGP